MVRVVALSVLERERRVWGLNAAATYFLGWVMTASAMWLRAPRVDSWIGCMKGSKATVWARGPESRLLADAALARELSSTGRNLLRCADTMADMRRNPLRNIGQPGCARRLGYTYPTWGGVADRSPAPTLLIAVPMML